MFGSQALETAIGLSVLFFVLATAASAATEATSRLFKKRAKDLERTIKDMLSEGTSAKDRGMAKLWQFRKRGKLVGEVRKGADPFLALLKDTSIWQAAEAAAGRNWLTLKPIGNSYLSAKSFAEAVNEVLTRVPKRPDGSVDLARADATIEALATRLPESLQKRLEVLVSDAKRGMLDVKAGLESWFDETMNRAEGAYKRWAQLILFLVGLVFAGLLNASAIDVARDLWYDSATRAAVADAATTISEDQQQLQLDDNEDDFVSVDEAADALGELTLPIGWNQGDWDEFTDAENAGYSALTVLGWLVTALLVMLGGPFWFDLLTKLAALRGAGKKPPTAAADGTSATSAASATPPPAGPAGGPYPTTDVAKAAQDAERVAYDKELEPVTEVLRKKGSLIRAVPKPERPPALTTPAGMVGWRGPVARFLARIHNWVVRAEPAGQAPAASADDSASVGGVGSPPAPPDAIPPTGT